MSSTLIYYECKGGKKMYTYGYAGGYGYNNGCCQTQCCGGYSYPGYGYGYGWGGSSAIILVLFILLVIVIGARIA